MHLIVQETDLIARINRLSGEVSNVRDLILSGSDSIDPDDANASLEYQWTDFPGFSDSSGVNLTIPKENLVIGDIYTITLIVSAGDRTSSTSITITVVS